MWATLLLLGVGQEDRALDGERRRLRDLELPVEERLTTVAEGLSEEELLLNNPLDVDSFSTSIFPSTLARTFFST